jgi:hypothetical protein
MTRQSEIDLAGPIRRTPVVLSGLARLREGKHLLQLPVQCTVAGYSSGLAVQSDVQPCWAFEP